jgi:hypothetical protein
LSTLALGESQGEKNMAAKKKAAKKLKKAKALQQTKPLWRDPIKITC